MKKKTIIKNTNIRLDLLKPEDRKAWEYLQTMDRKRYKSYTPPKSYTEDTLLSAMEKAGCDEIPDEAERKGLGTPATRAGVIEKLARIGFLERRGDKKTKYV